MCSILPTAPFDLVDLLLNFKGLQVIKFGLVRLELGVELVLARLFLRKMLACELTDTKARKV